MDAETLRRAVEPFFSTKGIGKGTGLGLSMAHGLAAQSGGLLTLSSRIGLGTVVTLWLPTAKEAAANKDAPAAADIRQHRGHILLVDDEPDVRATTASMLVDLGCTVTEASSAQEALSLLRGGLLPEALVTDHLMPGMLGSALIAEARLIRPGLPSMVVSGYADKATGLPADVQRLAKPFRTADLSAELDTLLRTSAAA
jgi:CheY-like chemotaxis protein